MVSEIRLYDEGIVCDPTVACPSCGGDRVYPNGPVVDYRIGFTCQECRTHFWWAFVFEDGATNVRTEMPREVTL